MTAKETHTRNPLRYRLVLLGLTAVISLGASSAEAQPLPLALPDFGPLPVGDPRLEPIPTDPIHLGNVPAFANGKRMSMRFPPRVNGQAQSEGDRHADLAILVYADTGLPVDQPSLLEAIPKNGAGPGLPVSDLIARLYSAAWEMHVVTVVPDYDARVAAEPELFIDSFCKLLDSPLVIADFETNMFFNCPVVPAGSTLDVGSAPIKLAFFEGELVSIAPYDIHDGPFNPQVLFNFEDQTGAVLEGPTPGVPHMVAASEPGQPFYSSIWEIWTVTVPNGTDVSGITSGQAIKDGGFPITSANIRLNCPVVFLESAPGSGIMESIPIEDAFAMLLNGAGGTIFDPLTFRIDLPDGIWTRARTFIIEEFAVIGAGALAVPFEADVCAGIPVGAGLNQFPLVEPGVNENVVPLILQNPFALTDPNAFPETSGPNSTGETIRFSQQDLDDAFPLLPPAIEVNFSDFVLRNLLSSDWLPGGQRSYQERLGLVGQALVELVWTPEQGAQQKDTTSCFSCHSRPIHGGSGTGLYTVDVPAAGVRKNPPPMSGAGARELLRTLAGADGSDTNTHAFGLQGDTERIRTFIEGAGRNHFGVRSAGIIMAEANVDGDPAALACDTDGDGIVSFDEAVVCDPDNDGVTNELSEGELTSIVVYALNLPVPAPPLTEFELQARGIFDIEFNSIGRGRQAFRTPTAAGGAGCADCHTVFHSLPTTEHIVTNRDTASQIIIAVDHHVADQQDVDQGLASAVGQPGLRIYADFQRHDMGSQMFSTGTSVGNTAYLWHTGSSFPYLRDGTIPDIRGAILAHGGEGLLSRQAFELLDAGTQQDIVNFLRVQLIPAGILLEADLCPTDPLKTEPGRCGCGVPDLDSDGDRMPDCADGCPADPTKTAEGFCGCGVPDIDTDGDGALDCFDACPDDPSKTEPGICGCGVPDSDADTDGDGTPDCQDECPNDPSKTVPGPCGCGVVAMDNDGDGVIDCPEQAPNSPGPNDGDGGGGDSGGSSLAFENCPESMTIQAHSPEGISVGFDLPTTHGNSGAVTLTIDPPPGSLFPIGTSTVTATATDDTAKTVTCTFDITVLPPDSTQQPATPDCGTGMCGVGGASLMPLMLMGLGLIRLRRRKTPRSCSR